ncbi:MAG: hypothetical protein ACI837_000628 [Crocinitomicaceae bacterium]|jgi:hypothetical protein
MGNRRLAYLAFVFSLLFTTFSWGQETLTIKYFGLTIHPWGDKTAALQPNKLDDNAHFVANVGLFVGYEKFLYRNIVSVKGIQGIMSDCSNGLASVTHFGVRGILINQPKHRVYFGIGPTLIVRDSWTRFGSAYVSSGYFNETYSKRLGDLQWKIIPYAFEFEYDYAFNETNQISLSVTPGVPAMIFSVGWKHWFHFKEYEKVRIFRKRKKGD